MRRAALVLLSTLSLGLAADSAMKEFGSFMSQETGGFDKYQDDLDKEFAAYQKAMDEEFKAYKKEIGAYWDEPKIDDPTQWTTYSKDKKTRTIVDFDKGEVVIQTQETDPKAAAAILKEEIERTITIDTQDALKNDELTQRIQKRIGTLSDLKDDKPGTTPVLADVFFDKTPGKKASDAVVKELLKGSQKSFQTTQKTQKKYVEARFPLPAQKSGDLKLPKYMADKAERLAPYAKRYAAKEKLSAPLVMAIMHCESAFNPMARSHVPAFGLMQIVPRTAGKDATKYLYGRAKLLSPSYLYNESNNVQTGSAYLHILYHNYLGKISNPQSRLYCTIAAYNTGSGNVAKAFTGSTNINKAADTINRLSPQEVYNRLLRSLPYDETKHYLKRVTERMHLYTNL